MKAPNSWALGRTAPSVNWVSALPPSAQVGARETLRIGLSPLATAARTRASRSVQEYRGSAGFEGSKPAGFADPGGAMSLQRTYMLTAVAPAARMRENTRLASAGSTRASVNAVCRGRCGAAPALAGAAAGMARTAM